MKEVFVLDSCAIIATLRKEYGADIVNEIYKRADKEEVNLIINIVNLLEIYYHSYRDKGKIFAENVLKSINNSKVIVHKLNDKIFLEAGRLKATYKISLADSVALAQAIVSGGELITADHHEFDVIEEQGLEGIVFCWIR